MVVMVCLMPMVKLRAGKASAVYNARAGACERERRWELVEALFKLQEAELERCWVSKAEETLEEKAYRNRNRHRGVVRWA